MSMAEPCVFEPMMELSGDISDHICDNCYYEKDEHCQNSDCRVCPGEYHICVELEGKLME